MSCDKKYKVIVIEPPWPFVIKARKVRPLQKREIVGINVNEIKKLPVGDLATDDGFVFVWTPQKHMRNVFPLLDAWGFKYHLTIVWYKKNGMCMFGFHRTVEFCIFGYRGKLNPYPARPTIPTYIQHRPRVHFEKPASFYKAIEVMGEPRVELFARYPREGWDHWGNNLEGNIEWI